MPNYVNCLRNVIDYTFSAAKAALKNSPLKAVEDKLEFVEAGARVGGAVPEMIIKAVQLLRNPRNFYKSEIGQQAVGMLEHADEQIRLKMAQGVDNYTEFFSTRDPLGLVNPGFTKKTRTQLYAASDEARSHDFFSGKIKAADLPQKEYQLSVPPKQEIVDMISRKPSAFGLKFIKDENGAEILAEPFGIDSDVMTRTISKLKGNQTPFDLMTLTPRQISLKVFAGKTADDVGFTEWFSAVYPQLIRKDQYDKPIKFLTENFKDLPGSEQAYTKKLIGKLTGKRGDAQATLDEMIRGAAENMGVDPEKMSISPSSQSAIALANQFYRGVIYGNPSMALVNLSQSINTGAKYGILRTIEGASNFASKDGRFLVEKAEAALFGDFHKFFLRNQSMLGKMDRWGYGLFQGAEYLNRGLAFHTAISDFMEKNGIKDLSALIKMGKSADKAERAVFQSAMREGVGGAAETQFVYSAVTQSPYLTGPLSRLVGGQFNSYMINQSEFLVRNIMKNPVGFTTRWIGLTGAAAALAHWGFGLEIGSRIGGGGMIPFAWDLWEGGHKKEAMLIAAEGLTNHLPNSFKLAQGLTPANGLLISTVAALGAMNSGDPSEVTKAMADMGRTWGTLIPGFLAMKSVSEAAMTALSKDQAMRMQGSEGSGKIGSFLEGMGTPVLVNKLAEMYFGGKPFPVGDEFTGGVKLADMNPKEIAIHGMGFRSKREDEQAANLQRTRATAGPIQQGRAILADKLALAVEKGDALGLQQLVQEGAQAGLLFDNADFRTMVGNALKARKLPPETKLLERLPRVTKLKILKERMENESLAK